ncbi:MAG: hypothetical protein ACOYXT_26265 [Bacteroidota bacterium]
MTTTDLKDIWQKANDPKRNDLKTQTDIRKIMEGQTSGIMRKIRNKLIIEVLIYLALTYAFVDLFDALEKSTTIVLFAGVLIVAGIVNNLVLYQFLKIRIDNDDLAAFLSHTIARLKRQLFFRLTFFGLFIVAMVLILMPGDLSSLISAKSGILFLSITIISIGIKLIFENQVWREHINSLRQSLQQLQEDE